MKIKRSTLIPAILAVYLDYAFGRTSALFYFGTIAVTVVILILLHFNIKHRERLRRERLEDIERSSSENKQNNTL